MSNRLANYLLSVGLFAISIAGCKDELAYNNSKATPFKIINAGHNVGLDENVLFLNIGVNAKGNPELTYYTTSTGLATIEINDQSYSNKIAQADPIENYVDSTLLLPKQYTTYAIKKDNALLLNWTNYGAPFADGALDVGDSVDFDVEIRFTQRPTTNTVTNLHSYPFVTRTWLNNGLPLENPADYTYSYRFGEGDGVMTAWDITHNQRLEISYRDFPDHAFGATYQYYAPRSYWPVCGNEICTCTFTASNSLSFTSICDTLPGASFITSREYIYVSREHYSDQINPHIGVNGGHLYKLAYALWPYSNDDLDNASDRDPLFYSTLPTYESGNYLWLKIVKVPPGLLVNLNEDIKYKNFIYDQTAGTLSIAGAKTIGNVSLQGVVQLDLTLRQKKTKVFSLLRDSTKLKTLHNHGLFKTGDGFVSAVQVESQDQTQNKITLVNLSSSLDTLFTAKINKVQLSPNSDFVPFFFEEDQHIIFFLFDAIKHALLKYEFSNSKIEKVWEHDVVIPSSTLPTSIVNMISYAPQHYVVLFDNNSLFAIDQNVVIDHVTPSANLTQMQLCNDNSRILFSGLDATQALTLVQFDLTNHHFANYVQNSFGFKSQVINHISGFVPDGAFTVLQLKSTSSSTEQVFFKTDNSLKTISGK